MSVTKTEIQCTVNILGKGQIYLKYISDGSAPRVEFEANSEDLVLLGRTAGRLYSYIPNIKGIYKNIVGTHLEEVLNAEGMNAVRNSAKDLPDKLRESLRL